MQLKARRSKFGKFSFSESPGEGSRTSFSFSEQGWENSTLSDLAIFLSRKAPERLFVETIMRGDISVQNYKQQAFRLHC